MTLSRIRSAAPGARHIFSLRPSRPAGDPAT